MRLDIIGRMLLGGAIRRALWRSPRVLLIGAALIGLALLSIGTARAQTLACQTANVCDKAEAYAACMAVPLPSWATGTVCSIRADEPTSWFCQHQYEGGLSGCGLYRFRECPASAPWDEATKTCKPPNNCAARPNYGGAMVSGASEFCHDGCAYTNAAEVSVCLGEGASMVCPGASWKPTGAECSSGPTPLPYDASRDTCQRKPGATHHQCVKPSGETCVTSAKGNRFCWAPGEGGDRMTADGSEGATRGQGTQQQAPPPAMTDPQPQGTSTTTTTTNNSTTVNATTVFSGSGSTGGQSNVGPGGRDATGGQGQGDGAGDGDGNGPGVPGGQPGRFYESNGKGISEAYDAFAEKARESPLIGAVGNVLGGCSGGGSCPTDTWDGGDYAGMHSLAEWCSGPLAALLAAAGYVLLAGMGAIALRISLL